MTRAVRWGMRNDSDEALLWLTLALVLGVLLSLTAW